MKAISGYGFSFYPTGLNTLNLSELDSYLDHYRKLNALFLVNGKVVATEWGFQTKTRVNTYADNEQKKTSIIYDMVIALSERGVYELGLFWVMGLPLTPR